MRTTGQSTRIVINFVILCSVLAWVVRRLNLDDDSMSIPESSEPEPMTSIYSIDTTGTGTGTGSVLGVPVPGTVPALFRCAHLISLQNLAKMI